MSSIEKINRISSSEYTPPKVGEINVPVQETNLAGEQPSEDTGVDVASLSNSTERIIDDNGDVHSYIRNSDGVLVEYKVEHQDNTKESYYYDNDGNMTQHNTFFPDGSHTETRFYDTYSNLICIDAEGKKTKSILYEEDGSEKEKIFDAEGNKLKVIHRKNNIVVERDCTTPVSDVVSGKKDGQEYLTAFYDKENNLTYLKKKVNDRYYIYGLDELKYLSHDTKKNLVLIPNMIIGKKLSDDIIMVRCAENEALKAGSKGSPEYENAYKAYIKAQMIKTPDNMKNIPSEVVEKDGKLFVNNGNELVELKISPEKYLDLFPPIERYDINQNNIGDCYFVAPTANMLQSSKGFVKILQMFSEDENGNVTVSLSNKYAKDNRPVLFPNGEPLPTDSKVGEYEYPSTEYRGGLDGAKGVRMLEQTFALNRYAKAHNYEYSIENIDIDLALHEEIDGGYSGQIYDDVFGLWGFIEDSEYYTTPKYLDSLAEKINRDERIYSFDFQNNESLDTNLVNSHVYNVELVDRIKKQIYLINPHAAGCSIVLPYEDLIKSFGTSEEQRKITTSLLN